MYAGSHFPDGLLERSVELGAVTDRSARVWIRQPGTPQARGTLSIDGRIEAQAVTDLSPDSDWTGALHFDLPQPMPDTGFTILVDTGQLHGMFTPTPGQQSGLTFAMGSCNRPFLLERGKIVYNQAAGIYDALAADMERAGARFLLLTGDQIYSDEFDPISVREGHLSEAGCLPSMDDAVSAYRHISRGYLGVPGFQRLRERFSTLTIWDDHDIFDNWGSRKEVSALDHRMFEAASQVYSEYQHVRNPGTHSGRPPYHYTYQFGDIGFLVLDVRGFRDWSEGQMLGDEQWDDIIAYLEGQASEEITTLFVVSSVPLAHVARWMTELFEMLPGTFGDAVRDRWSARAYRAQRDELLARLCDWQASRPGRQVVALSGDVHVAGAYTIRARRGPGRIEQFTSSAFTTPLTSSERYMNVFAARGSNLFEPRWKFERHFINYANNGGLIRLTPLDSGGHVVEFLVRGWDRRERNLRTVARHSSATEGANRSARSRSGG